jgi:hypothetical protein
MEKVKVKSEKAWAYLDKWPKEAWTKAYFSEAVKCDNICNNACECFNAKILKYRGKPILTMLEEIRCYIMRTMANNKMKLRYHEGALPPMQKSKLEKEKRECNRWLAHWTGDGQGNRYEVHSMDTKVDVNLETYTCSCRAWQLTGMPCRHAISAIALKNAHPENYVHAWLTMGAYKSTYEYYVKPTESQQYWVQSNYAKLNPPKVPNRKAGRPKKNRRKDSVEEPVAGSKLKRKYPPIICTRCGLENHNTRSCQNQGVPIKPKKWVQGGEDESNVEDQTELSTSQNSPNEMDSS